ncbi:MAG: hypothetical protein SPJ62_03275, partial [Inconstantimicrobium porci]|uniref:hypothetical protein n=1 Tax=Inconstantimicrobium porci TaxID=2652291 RepID=UPI002A9B03FF|nr:hypothetical protein [Inconstantimicrobium porci]
TLPLLNVFKTKMQEWTSSQDQTLKTELLQTIGNITSFEIDVVESLPATGTKGHIYFVPKTAVDEKNIYDEYIWVVKEGGTSAFEKIGDTKIDTDALKSETLAEVSTNYIKTVTVTPQTDESSGITTYTFSFKNGAGTEISTASIVTGGGYSLATAEKDGLMSKADKAKLDSYELVTDAEIENLFKTVSGEVSA